MRGNCVSKPIVPSVKQYPQPSYVNDWIIYAIFARLTLSNNDTIEFDTVFNEQTNTIELCVPDEANDIFNQITGTQRGTKFKRYIDWLIGSDTVGDIEAQFKEYQGYKEFTYDGSGQLSAIDAYADNTKTIYQFNKTFTYSTGKLAQSVLIKFETGQTSTKTFIYDVNGKLISSNVINS